MSVEFSRDTVMSLLQDQTTSITDFTQKIRKGSYDSSRLWNDIKKYSLKNFSVTLLESFSERSLVANQIFTLETFLTTRGRKQISFKTTDEPVSKKRKKGLNDSFINCFDDLGASDSFQKKYEDLLLVHQAVLEENAQLKKRNSELEEALNIEKSKGLEISDFISRKTTTGGFGKPSEGMLKFCLSSLLNAESAKSLQYFLNNLKMSLPLTFQGINVLSDSYLKQLRSVFPQIQSSFLNKFVNDSEQLILCHDGSPNLDGVDLLAILLVNETGKSAVISLIMAPDKSAVGMCESIMTELKSVFGQNLQQLADKTVQVQSDRARAALNCSEMIYEELNKISERPRIFTSCFMHTSMHVESRSISAPDKKPDDLKTKSPKKPTFRKNSESRGDDWRLANWLRG